MTNIFNDFKLVSLKQLSKSILVYQKLAENLKTQNTWERQSIPRFGILNTVQIVIKSIG